MKNCTCDCHVEAITEALLARFWNKVQKSDGCWNWQGHKSKYGYGLFKDENRRLTGAHRFSYRTSIEPIPDGKIVDHVCRNRACVNPSHLRLVSHAENVQNQAGHRDSKSGHRGVSWHASSGKWRAVATAFGKTHYAGYFMEVEEAAEAARLLRMKIQTHNTIDRMVTK